LKYWRYIGDIDIIGIDISILDIAFSIYRISDNLYIGNNFITLFLTVLREKLLYEQN